MRGDPSWADELRRAFPRAGEALERAEAILDLQHAALAVDPPLQRLPDSVRLAASARLRSGEPIIPRDRTPIEPRRVANLLRALARTVLELDAAAAFEAAADAFVEAALAPAVADDARGVQRAAELVGLPAEAASALLREALKPELVRVSRPFRGLLGDAARPGRCPLCAGLPSCASAERSDACCRWCGLTWRWDASTCASCGRSELRRQEIRELVRGAGIVQCLSCGDAVTVFDASPDPLLLSMLGVLVAPFDLALRHAAHATPRDSFRVF